MSDTQPSVQGGSALSRDPGGAPAPAGLGVKILLVDDQPAKLLSYEAVLSGLGVQCVRALSGDEALGHLLKHDFATILLDVNMPRMDGFEVARLIRSHRRFQHTPIVFITGQHADELSRIKGYEVGAIDYISVPVAPEVLRSKVAVLVELFRRRSELQELNQALHEAQVRLQEEHDRALRASEERYHLAAEAVQGLIYEWDVPSDEVRYSKGITRLLGFTYQDVPPSSLWWTSRIHTDDMPALKGALQRRGRDDDGHREVELRLQHRDGHWVYVRDHFIAQWGAAGELLRVVGNAIDVNKQHMSEERLRQDAERRYRALLQNAPVGVVYASMTGRIGYANGSFCELLGYTADELLERTWQDITHPDDLERDRLLGQQVLAGKLPHYTMEKRYIRKDGTPVWTQLFGNFVMSDEGHPLEGVGIVIDITERKQAADALRESEQRFRALANTIDQFAWTCDELGYATWYNDRWYEYTGTTLEDMIGDGWRRVVHPAHLDRVIEHLKRCLSTGQPWEDTFPICGADGAYRWFLSRAVPIRSPEGKVSRWFGTNTDVTDLRALQQALENENRHKDEFLAMLAHELRNPVAPIRNAAEVLAKLASGDGKQLATVNIVQRQTRHLARLLDDLLDVARINQGRIELRREPVGVQSLLESSIETVAPATEAKKQRISVTCAPGAPLFVLADPVRMTQCLSNVLANATKFTPGGGDIRVTTRQDGAHVLVEISDTGAGIAPQLLPHVFDMFVQGKRSLERAGGGLGIGLSVCKQIVEMHGGTITVASGGEGRGTAVAIRLPLVSPPAVTFEETSTPTPTSRRILIVDDNHDAADSLVTLLQLHGHEPEAVYSAADALERTRQSPAEVVILDIGLPHMDGYELARRIRAMHPSLLLIALSGYGRPEDKQRASAAGFNLHLIKPVDLEALQQAIIGTCNGFARPLPGKGTAC